MGSIPIPSIFLVLLHFNGVVAQWLERAAHNRLVVGSNPSRPTFSER